MKTNERKLISTTDFVLEQKEYIKEVDNLSFFEIQTKINGFYDKVIHHAIQMKRVLEKGMFVPTDDAGNVLEEPIKKDMEWFKGLAYGDFSCDYNRIFEFTEAKERVLFKGFYSTDENTVSNGEINIIFGGLTSLIVLGNNGYGGISKSDMIVEDLVEYGLILARDLQPMFEKNRGVSQPTKEKEMLNKLGWK